MTLETSALLDALDSAITIPIIPFKEGTIDYDGHAQNIEYLMKNNRLEGGRKRVISVAGTSLIHHIEPEEQTRLFDITGQVMGDDGVLMSAVVPYPTRTAGQLIEEQAKLQRPPDVTLIMPLGGTYSTEGYDLGAIMAKGIDSGAVTREALLDYLIRKTNVAASGIRTHRHPPVWHDLVVSNLAFPRCASLVAQADTNESRSARRPKQSCRFGSASRPMSAPAESRADKRSERKAPMSPDWRKTQRPDISRNRRRRHRPNSARRAIGSSANRRESCGTDLSPASGVCADPA